MIKLLKIIFLTLAIAFMVLGPFRILRVTSGSMEPALKTGSYIVVNKNYPMGKVKEGDIVVFLLAGGGKAAHRVVDVKSEGFVTKGDANPKEDLFLVTKDIFLGKIISWKRDC